MKTKSLSYLKRKRILVTGSTGFIGSYLFTKINGSYSKNWRRTDLLNFKATQKRMEELKPDIIYHLGAVVNLSNDYKITKKCLEVNTIGTLNLLEALRNCPPKRFIFASTEDIYGDNKLPFKEDQVPQPSTGYSVSKLAAENLCKIYAKTLGFKLVILRIGPVYEKAKPSFKKDYVYLDDVLEALILAGSKELKNQIEIINIGGGTSFLLDKDNYTTLNVKHKRWLMDIKKAKRLLNWKPNERRK